MPPSIMAFSHHVVRAMPPDQLATWTAQLQAETADYTNELNMRSDIDAIHEALAYARWIRPLERLGRSMPPGPRLIIHEQCVRADRSVGVTIFNARRAGNIRRSSRQTDAPALSDLGVSDNAIPHNARALARLDTETFEAALAKAKADLNVSGTHLLRVVDGQQPPRAQARRIAIAELAAEGLNSTEIGRHLGYSDEAWSVKAIAARYDIDIPGDRDPAIRQRRRTTDASVSGINSANLQGVRDALAALGYVLDQAEDMVHPMVAPDAQAWVKELTKGRTHLSRLIHILKEAANS